MENIDIQVVRIKSALNGFGVNPHDLAMFLHEHLESHKAVHILAGTWEGEQDRVRMLRILRCALLEI